MPSTHHHSPTRRAPVLVTGVSSGIGLGLVKKLLGEGYPIFGTVRSDEKATELRAALGASFTPLVCDVGNQRTLSEAEEVVRQALPDRRFAAIINNAGSAQIGPLLHVAPEALAHQLDTLVVGQLRVIQTFFPYLAPSVGPPGKIFNISSVSGVGVNRYFGCYAAGKHALEGLSKTLRDELQRYGIRVVVVAPGNVATDIWPKQTGREIEEFRGTDYFPDLEQFVRDIPTQVVPGAMTVQEFANAFFSIFSQRDPKQRYTVVKAKRHRFLPARVRVLEH